MIIAKDLLHYNRIKPYCKGSMLMLGHQLSELGDPKELFECTEYSTLDPDCGNYKLDLNSDLGFLDHKFDIVFNLGTIEHVWNVHQAYCNAARMVKVNGFFIGHAPVENWPNHGMHVTTADAIIRFLELNSFKVLETWKSDNVIHWVIAKKLLHITNFSIPQQIWDSGNITKIL